MEGFCLSDGMDLHELHEKSTRFLRNTDILDMDMDVDIYVYIERYNSLSSHSLKN